MLHASVLVSALLAATAACTSPSLSLLASDFEGHQITRRQNAAATDPFVLVSPPPENRTQWDEETNAACVEALSGLDRITNPSGNCVCYNVLGIDTNTGVFQAELRLYKLGAPRDEFVGIADSDIQVGLSYNGSSVEQVGQSAVARRDAMLLKRQEGRVDPMLMQLYEFRGEIDAEQMATGPMNMGELEALLMPEVTLSAVVGEETVSTQVSMNEASLVNGVFSNTPVFSITQMAQMAVDEQLEGLANGTVVFQVPGIRLMVFPVGLIITGTWVVAFVAVVGYGTFGRMTYRQQFRRRTAAARKGGMGTI